MSGIEKPQGKTMDTDPEAGQVLRSIRTLRFLPITLSRLYELEHHMLIAHRISITYRSITANSRAASLTTCEWRRSTTNQILGPSKTKRKMQSCSVRAQPMSGIKD
jgi:hypothetical protein